MARNMNGNAVETLEPLHQCEANMNGFGRERTPSKWKQKKPKEQHGLKFDIGLLCMN